MNRELDVQSNVAPARKSAAWGIFLSLLLLAQSGIARVENPVIWRVLEEEMARSVGKLQLDTIPGPYFLAFRVDETRALRVTATLGSIEISTPQQGRTVRVVARVGSPVFDNTNFFSFGSGSGLRYAAGASGITTDNDADAMRRDLWLSVDAAYKTSLEELAKKRAAFEHKTRSDDSVDFLPAPAGKGFTERPEISLDSARWNTLARELSAVFRAYPGIQSSTVSVSATNSASYYLTSEGARAGENAPLVLVQVSASTQAPDGMPLSDGLQFLETPVGDTMNTTPAQMRDAVRAMAERLVALRSAPVLDEYNGPVLVDDEASAEIFGQFFGDALCAIRRPDVDNPQLQFALTMLANESPYQSRIGSRILPDGFTVVDDPTRETYDGVRLTGIQTFDDEGVPSPEVTLVEHGVLKTLLSSRTPHKRIQATNGHASGTPARPTITSLIVSDGKGVGDDALRAKLIEQCKERGLPYGLRIARLMPGSVRSTETSDMRMMIMGMLSGQEGTKLTAPTEVYRVYPDGHEELVRGVELSGVNTAAFKEILLGGKRQYVYNSLMDFKGMSSPFSGAVSKGVSIIVPPVLFDELTATKMSGPFKTLPVVAAPAIEN